MKHLFLKSRTFIVDHKILSGIIFVAIVFGGYKLVSILNSSSSPTVYALGAVEKGTIVSSVTGTGQISASNEVEIKSKVSGDVLSVRVKNGTQVKEGDVIAQIDSTDALQSVTDAKNSLRSAQISLEKTMAPADETTRLQTQNAVTSATQAKQNAEDAIDKSYDDGFNTMASTFLDMQPAILDIQDILNRSYLGDNTISIQYSSTAKQYKTDAEHEYYAAKKKYTTAFTAYKNISRASDQTQLDAVIVSAYDAAREMANAVKELNILLDYIERQNSSVTPSDLATDQATIDGYTSKLNGDVASLLATQTSITTAKDSLASAQRTIEEKDAALQNLEDGADPLDIESAKLAVAQREADLTSARTKLADYTIRAPFDGVITNIGVERGDTLSSNGSVATIVTEKEIATISLNETDVTNVKVGQKATLTFDAIDDLTIAGEVSDVDIIGTVSQGVVSYDVEIAFDTDDSRIKPGMSVSAAIITDVHQDILMVPISAVKTQGESSYIEYFDAVKSDTPSTQITSSTAPLRKTVVTGASNDSYIEIVSGLAEGDMVVTKTTTGSNTKTTTTTSSTRSATSLLGGGGGGGGPRGL